MDNIQNKSSVSLADAANIRYLSPDDVRFFKSGDFVGAEFTFPGKDPEKYDRVWFHRSFPLDMPEKFISVLNSDSEEIGLIRDVSAFESDAASLIRDELLRKYHTPKILKILSLKETRGYSFWKALTDAGEISFSIQDTYRNINKVSKDRAFITDISGNRYEIESIEALDKKSLRRLEIYL